MPKSFHLLLPFTMLLTAPLALFGQIDKTRGPEKEQMDELYRGFKVAIGNENRDQALSAMERMQEYLNTLVNSACPRISKLNDARLGYLADETQKFCEQISKLRDKANKVREKLEKTKVPYQSEAADFKSEYDTLMKMLDQLYGLYLKAGQALKESCRPCVN